MPTLDFRTYSKYSREQLQKNARHYYNVRLRGDKCKRFLRYHIEYVPYRNGFEKNINTIYYDVLAIVALWPFEAVGRIWSVQVVRETKSGAHKCFLTQVTTISVGRFFYSGIIFPHIFLLLKKKIDTSQYAVYIIQ